MRVPFHDDHSNECYVVFVSAVMMSGYGGWIGGHIMPIVQLPAVTPKHNAWNKGRIMGQKRPLRCCQTNENLHLIAGAA